MTATHATRPKRKRGRSLTVRKNATNAEENRYKADFSTSRVWWWERLAIFGESYGALLLSAVLLGTAVALLIMVESSSESGASEATSTTFGLDLTGVQTLWRRMLSPKLRFDSWLGKATMGSSNGWSLFRDCSIDKNAVPALHPGDLNRLFGVIAENYSDHSSGSGYTATVHSGGNQALENLPWIITLDNFLSEEECDALIELGIEQGFQRSMDVGQPTKLDGGASAGKETERRTSASAWCTMECRNKQVPGRVHHRISDLLGIPPENSEDLQVLKYDVGQCYKVHHDYIPHQRNRQCGPRILTVFMYLSDVPAGGETRFPFYPIMEKQSVTIKPKKGMALVFPNVYDSDPTKADFRTRHEALPVLEGTKYAANAWIHMYDYQTAVSNGCN